MAMTECTECGRDVSDRAAKCPHCGISFVPSAGVQVARGVMFAMGIFALVILWILVTTS